MVPILPSLLNPVLDLTWEEGALDTYKKYGYLMFPQQKKIYQNITDRFNPMDTVVEAGCGIGLGTAMMQQKLRTSVIGSDNLHKNVQMASCLYPWITFIEWDICDSRFPHHRVDTVVAIEVIEHVDNPVAAIKNLCDLSLRDMYISTPNGIGKKRPPDNPHHVCEYTPFEMMKMVAEVPGNWGVEMLDWDTFKPVGLETKVDPIVYHLKKERT